MPDRPRPQGEVRRIWTADEIARGALGHGVDSVWLHLPLRNYLWIPCARGEVRVVIAPPGLPPEGELDGAAAYLAGADSVGWGRFMAAGGLVPRADSGDRPAVLVVQGEVEDGAVSYAAPFLRRGQVVRMRVPYVLLAGRIWGTALR